MLNLNVSEWSRAILYKSGEQGQGCCNESKQLCAGIVCKLCCILHFFPQKYQLTILKYPCHILLHFKHDAIIKKKNTYGRKQSGCERAKNVGFLPFILWVFLTIYIFVALMKITMWLKQLEASHIMSYDSWYWVSALRF